MLLLSLLASLVSFTSISSLTFPQTAVLTTLGLLALPDPANAIPTSPLTRRSLSKRNDNPTPEPPKLQYLFTANLKVVPNAPLLLPGPKGIRLNIPIIGGTFEGLENNVSGSILGDTADWATIDPLTGIATADARWAISLPTTNSTQGLESLIFVTTSGPSLEVNSLNKAHLRLILETGVPEYYYLNNIVAIGTLEILNPTNTTIQDVRIEAFNFEDDWKATDEPFAVGQTNPDELDSYRPSPGFMADDSPIVEEDVPDV